MPYYIRYERGFLEVHADRSHPAVILRLGEAMAAALASNHGLEESGGAVRFIATQSNPIPENDIAGNLLYLIDIEAASF